MKKIFTIVLTSIMIFWVLFGCYYDSSVVNAKNLTTKTVKFGSYPQSMVTDSNIISELNQKKVSWTSYGYYSGNGTPGLTEQGDWMKYADVYLEGNKYRAVTFSQYRPQSAHGLPDSDSSSQDYNGYFPNNVYWFKYEPIKWSVLDENSGLLLCEYIIDSQPFHYEYFYDGEGDLYDSAFGDKLYTTFANNYPASTIREWLNNDFYNTAFSKEEKSEIHKNVCENKSSNSDYALFDCETTEDYVFLLSKKEVCNPEYGFARNYLNWDETRCAQGTDYAKAQGLSVSDNSEFLNNSHWWLRTPGEASPDACYIDEAGYGTETWCTRSNKGIRPAIRLTEVKTRVPISIDMNYKDTKEISSLLSKGDFSYTSSDINVVSVDKNGVITATGRGKAIVTCTPVDNLTEVSPISIAVNVEFTTFQWIIWILFLGFLWY